MYSIYIKLRNRQFENVLNEPKLSMFEKDKFVFQTHHIEIARDVYNNISQESVERDLKKEGELWTMVSKYMVQIPLGEKNIRGFQSMPKTWFVEYK